MSDYMKKVVVVSLMFLLVMSITSQSVKAEGALTEIFDMIKNWFESSPFGNIFTMPVKRMDTLNLEFYPDNFAFDTSEYVNITSNESTISGFKGSVEAHLGNDVIMMKSSESPITIEQKIGEVKIQNVVLAVLDLKDMKLVMTSGNWTNSAENGSLTIRDFLGDITVRKDSIELNGNVSTIVKN